MVEFPRQRPGVDQFERIDPCGRRGGDVPDVVRARAPRDDPEVVESGEDLGGAPGGDLADLKVRPRGDVSISPAETVGEVGDTPELPGRDDPGRQPEPAHVGILRGGDVEEAVELREEDVRAFREDGAIGAVPDLAPDFERVLLTLGLLLRAERLPLGQGPVLRPAVDRVGAVGDRLGRGDLDGRGRGRAVGEERPREGRAASGRAGEVDARDEPFEVALLLLRHAGLGLAHRRLHRVRGRGSRTSRTRDGPDGAERRGRRMRVPLQTRRLTPLRKQDARPAPERCRLAEMSTETESSTGDRRQGGFRAKSKTGGLGPISRQTRLRIGQISQTGRHPDGSN